MTMAPPVPPAPIRVLNAASTALRRLGIGGGLLTADALITEARKSTGLDDFGPGPFREGLDVLIGALYDEAALTPMGWKLAERELLKGLSVQLQIQDWYLRHPEIAHERVEAPLVIIGMPRTGTTILHELLQLDPLNRVPETWEVNAPCPPPEAATYATDRRIRKEKRQLRFTHYLIPELPKMHRMGPRLPQECIVLTAHLFHSMVHSTIFRVPSYQQWLTEEADLAPVYAYHRRMLQLLQWRAPGARWVLKSPGHLWSLDALLAEYPDARLVQTHRDPLKIESSLASMIPTIRSMYSDDLVVEQIAEEWAFNNTHALDASVTFRESGAIAPDRVVDIAFDDFMADQVGQVRRIYDHFGYEFTDGFADAIDAYIAANPHDKGGGHQHHFGDSGLDYATERERSRRYTDYFAVRQEF
jgi:hypothetical protein